MRSVEEDEVEWPFGKAREDVVREPDLEGDAVARDAELVAGAAISPRRDRA